ncbi:DUF3445 domain-containing protein [Zavarzinia compransoris]|uniref:heme-dependent oxidative N-demethylase family protein n=1 Tax=Zavarzinia marina TaxID=2911065 RepID=UPI001F4921C2|nr:DUF3445 domain-containing protein [Zavarzinia marina]MCF4167467.1 DUF3445 domain-containing protein [Zavarzinia marina]
MIPYVPFSQGPYRMQMGLAGLDLRDWIQIDADYGAEIAEKFRLIAHDHDAVFRALPGSEAMGAEVLALLVDHLPRRFPERFAIEGDDEVLVERETGRRHDLRDAALHPLDRAGRLVQEDLCVMAPSGEGEAYRLVAASVSFPARWALADKIGRPLAAIHGPVPNYDARLGGAMDRFFAVLRTDRPVWRTNWSMHDDPALFQTAPHGDRAVTPPIGVADAGTRLYLRSERQTLRRLPVTGAVLFTIRTYQCPLATIAADPEAASLLAGQLATMPAETVAYKGLTRHRDAVLAYLKTAAAA